MTKPWCTVALCLTLISSVSGKGPSGVCRLLKNRHSMDHKVVTVSGFIYADRHSTALGNSECSELINCPL